MAHPPSPRPQRPPGLAARALGRWSALDPAARRFLVGSAFMGAAHAFPWTLLSLFLDAEGYGKPAIGFVLSGEAWGKLAAALPAALLLARWKDARVLGASAFAAALCYAALPWMPGRWALFSLNAASGFVWAIHYIAIAPFLFRRARAADRAILFGLAEAVHTLAAVLGALLAGRLASALGAHFVDPAQGMAVALSLSGLLPLAAAWAYIGIQPAPTAETARAPLLPRVLAHRGLLGRFALPQLLLGIGSGLTVPFLALYLSDRFGFGPKRVGDLNAASQVLMSVGFLASPWIARYLGLVRGAAAVQFASIPFFLVLAFAVHPWLASAAFLLRAGLMNTAHPLAKNFSMQACPEGLREVQNALTSTSWGIGWVVGPLLGGRLLEANGNDYSHLMLGTVVLYLVGATASWVLLRPLERHLEAAAHESASSQAVERPTQVAGKT